MVERKEPWLWKFIIEKDSLLGLLNLNIFPRGDMCNLQCTYIQKMRFIWYVAFSRNVCSLRSTDSRSLNRILWNSAPYLFRYFWTKRCKLQLVQVQHSSTSQVMTARTIWPPMRLKDLVVFWNVVALYHFIVVLFQQLNLSCSFWKRVTLNAICDHRRKYFQTYQADCEFLFSKVIPNSLHFIYYVDINIAFKLQKDGRCCLLGVQMVN